MQKLIVNPLRVGTVLCSIITQHLAQRWTKLICINELMTAFHVLVGIERDGVYLCKCNLQHTFGELFLCSSGMTHPFHSWARP